MSEDEKPSSRIRFDGTINWPFIILCGSIVLGAIGFGNRVVSQVDSVLIMQEKQTQKVDKLTESVDNIRLDLAKQDGLRQKVEDHEVRIRALEAKP